MDKSEYSSVFKVFDRENTGQIEIGQVMELIQNLEESAKESGAQQIKQSSLKDGSNTLGGPKSASDKSKLNSVGAKSPGRKKNAAGLGAKSGHGASNAGE